MLIGRASHQIDPKGRIRIPAKFKDKLGENPYITCGLDECLYVFPKKVYESQVLERFKNSDYADLEQQNAIRYLVGDAEEGDEDNQGRMVLPQHLINHAKIDKNIVSIGMIDHIEIWNEEAYEKHQKETNRIQAFNAIKKDKDLTQNAERRTQNEG